MAIFDGTAGNDKLTGTADSDTFNLQLGGRDTVIGLDGIDVIDAGASFNSLDRINGGGGSDILRLEGDYSAGITLAADTLRNVEQISLYGNHAYKLATNDATVAAGKFLSVLQFGEATVNFDGSAETNGRFLFTGGKGNDKVIGGAQDDEFLTEQGDDEIHGGGGNDLVGGKIDALDTIDGGAGNDTLELEGDYSGTLNFADATVQSIETLQLEEDLIYFLASADATVAAGKSMTVTGQDIEGAGYMNFNGSQETDGSFRFIDGSNNDAISGGAKNDLFDTNQGGNDTFAGGDGNDIFNLGAALEGKDFVFGGAGIDRVTISGDYSVGTIFGQYTLFGIESLTVAAGNDYRLATDDFNVDAGAKLDINAGSLGAADALDFDGSFETNGRFAILGGKGSDTVFGGAKNDVFNAGLGGSDQFFGGTGDDAVVFQNSFSKLDFFDGGAGSDRMSLSGQYNAGLALGSANVKNVETFALGAGFSYNITALDTLIAFAASIVIDASALNTGQSLTFNGAGETDGHLDLIGGAGNDLLRGGGAFDFFTLDRGGNDTVIGGDGDDEIFVNGSFNALDRLDGGEGNADRLYLDGNFSAGLTLQAPMFKNIEAIELTTGNDYKFTITNGTVAANNRLEISAFDLKSGSDVTIDGSTETDGVFLITTGAGADSVQSGQKSDQTFTGAGNDVIKSFAGNDSIGGGRGMDLIDGGAGNDRFYYFETADSAPNGNRDIIQNYNAGDKFDFSFIDTDPGKNGNQGFIFIGGNSFSADGKAEIRVTSNGASTFIRADVDGNGVDDMQVAINGVHVLAAGDFFL